MIACCVFILVLLIGFFLFYIFFGLFVVFAGVLARAVAAVDGRLADGFLRSEGDAVGFFAGAHDFFGLDGGDLFGKLGGDLEAIEKEAGAAGVHVGRVEGAEYLGQGDLDSPGILDGEGDEFFGSGGVAVAVQVLMVVAIGLVAKGRGALNRLNRKQQTS